MSKLELENEEFPFIFDSIKLGPAVELKNVIKVPVTFVSEMVKYYSENGKYYFMPYEEIKDGLNWHKENLSKLPLTENHVPLFEKDLQVRPVKDSEVIGYLSQMEGDDEHRNGKGWAYFIRSKLHPQIIDALIRGHVLGVSMGGFNKHFGPPGYFKGQKYDASQMGLRFHHGALITIGLPRCPTNMCGFNFTDAEFPWEDYHAILIQRFGLTNKADKILELIKTKYSNAFNHIKDQFSDSSSALQECVSAKIEHIYHEYDGKKKKPKRDKIQAMAYSYCREKLGIKDSFDFSLELPPTDFKDFHESLILENIIPSDSCVREFWDAYRGTIDWLEFDVINTNLSLFIDNLLSIKNDEAIKVTNEELELLKKQNEKLQAEISELKNAKFTDAEKLINELQTANKEFADANAKLLGEKETLEKEVNDFRKEEIETMQKVIYDSKGWSAQEIAQMNYTTLKTNYNIVKRLSGNNTQVLRPQPASQYSTLPRPGSGGVIQDAEPSIPPRKYRLGMPPPIDVIMNEKDDHWKTRFPKGG